MIDIRTKKILAPALTLILGAVGAVLRKIELNTVFEPSGLAKPGQPVTIALAVLSALAAIYFIADSVSLKKLAAEDSYFGVFAGGIAPFIVSALGAAGLAAGSVMYYLSGGETLLSGILMLLGLASAASVLLLSYGAYKKKGDAHAAAVFSTLIILFVCLFMVLEYKFRSADPVLLDYVYDFLALCAAALAFYYRAGFAYSSPKPAQTVALSRISAFFCIVAIPGASGKAQTLFFAGLALTMLADMPALIGNLKEKAE